MTDRTETLEELRSVIRGQMDLLNLILFAMSEGPADYKGQRLTCILDTDQTSAAAAVAMGAGQSLGTVLQNSAERGVAVRDLYPIARSVVEGFINGAFFVTQPKEVAQRALSHRNYAAWKHHNRVIGSGEFMITMGSRGCR